MKLHTLSYSEQHGWSQAQLPVMDDTNMLILLFGAPEFINLKAPFETLSATYPNAQMAGCSTSGEIHQNEVRDDSLTIALIQFEKSHFKTVTMAIEASEQSYEVGCALSKQIDKTNLRGVFVLSDGLKINGSLLVAGLNESLPEGTIITGGLAGDKENFTQTWVINRGFPETGCVSAICFYGDSLEIGYGSQGGWNVFGPKRRITRSHSNIVYEIDGRPALDLYKEYLGERAVELPGAAMLFPLAIRQHNDQEHYVVRTILAIDEKEKSMTFAGDMPQEWCCQLMWANMDTLIDGASIAGKQVGLNTANSEVLSLAVSCVGRRIVLRMRSDEEVESTLEHLPEGTKQIGFYSYGEISPMGFGACGLHNQTMTLTTIYEK